MSLMTYRLSVPVTIRLRLDSAKIERAVGGRVATHVRKLLKGGRAPGGKALRTPQDHGEPGSPSRAPLQRTGQLIRSIRYQARSGLVAPAGVRSDPGRTRGRHWRRNYAVYAILVRSHLQPGLEVDDDTAELMSRTAAEQIQRQLASPRGGLRAELRRISRGYR